MRTILKPDDALQERVAALTRVRKNTALVRCGRQAREAARRLARLGATQRQLRPVSRRRVGKG